MTSRQLRGWRVINGQRLTPVYNLPKEISFSTNWAEVKTPPVLLRSVVRHLREQRVEQLDDVRVG